MNKNQLIKEEINSFLLKEYKNNEISERILSHVKGLQEIYNEATYDYGDKHDIALEKLLKSIKDLIIVSNWMA